MVSCFCVRMFVLCLKPSGFAYVTLRNQQNRKDKCQAKNPHIKSTLEFVHDSSFSLGNSESAYLTLAHGKYFLSNICASALPFSLHSPSLNDEVKKCSHKDVQCVAFRHHHLPVLIIAVPILCLKQYFFYILLKNP